MLHHQFKSVKSRLNIPLISAFTLIKMCYDYLENENNSVVFY